MDLMTLAEIEHELRQVERELRDLDEAIADSSDICASTRLRVRRRGLLQRLDELKDAQLRLVRAA